jgi:hypothetical protein
LYAPLLHASSCSSIIWLPPARSCSIRACTVRLSFSARTASRSASSITSGESARASDGRRRRALAARRTRCHCVALVKRCDRAPLSSTGASAVERLSFGCSARGGGAQQLPCESKYLRRRVCPTRELSAASRAASLRLELRRVKAAPLLHGADLLKCAVRCVVPCERKRRQRCAASVASRKRALSARLLCVLVRAGRAGVLGLMVHLHDSNVRLSSSPLAEGNGKTHLLRFAPARTSPFQVRGSPLFAAGFPQHVTCKTEAPTSAPTSPGWEANPYASSGSCLFSVLLLPLPML